MVSLDELLATAERAVPAQSGPVWVSVNRCPNTDVQVRLRFDVDRLLGWVAPASCVALGLISGGWAHRLPGVGGDVPPGWNALPARVRIGCLIDREGRLVARTGFPGGAQLEEPPTSGRLLDTLRRCLVLPTDPPRTTTAPLLASLWLGEIVNVAEAPGAHLQWPTIAALHPAMRVLSSAGEDLGVEHFDMISRVATKAWSWERLRRQAAEGSWIGGLIGADLAGWMDEGMFSRWLLDQVRPAPELLVQVAPQLSRHCLNRVQRSISGASPLTAGSTAGLRGPLQ